MPKYYNAPKYENYRELITKTAEKYGKRTAFKIRKSEKEYTYITFNQFRDYYYALCTKMLNEGLRGKRIAVAGANCFEWCLCYCAASTVGVVVPIDKELQAQDVKDFLNAADCVAIYTDCNRIEKLKAVVDREIIYNDFAEVVPSLIKATPAQEQIVNEIKIGKDEMRILIFTSGTTGNSKGVCLSQNNICSNIYSTACMVKIHPTDVTLSILPIHHTYECTLDFLYVHSSGACITYCDSLTKVAKNITEYRPTILVVVPALLKILCKRIKAKLAKEAPEKYRKYFDELSLAQALEKCPFIIRKVIVSKVRQNLGGKLRCIFVGAAELDVSLIADFGALGIKVLQGYGLTECSPLLAGNNDFHLNVASTGPAIPGVEIKIDNPNEEGIGEILAKSESIMLGYYNDPEATAAVFRDGWFCTGDLGKIDSEGDLYIKGRIKNVIVTENGKNIYPEELETRLSECPEVGEVLVFGADNNGETSVKAKILPNLDFLKEKLGRTPSEDEIKKAVQEIVKKVNSKIPNYKHIKIVEVLSSALEKTTTQKIKRFGQNVK